VDKNLTEDRYKTCGYGKPIYNREGDYDEVSCGHDKSTGFCGEQKCPLDTKEKI